MSGSDEEVGRAQAGAWWREWEAWTLLLLGLAIYVPRLADIPLRGEETRRAGIAIEMLRSGDWVVPRLQESPIYFRPPLQNWAIAVGGLVRGDVDEIAIRWPSVASVLLLGLLIYAYSRTCLGRVGAMAAGAAFITMGQVLELGRLGETDPLMTMMVAASLLVWHYGRLRGWSPVWYWSAGYLLAALATLTKGAQGPVYFAATVGGFLLWTGRWREAFRWSHLVGILVFVATMALWHVPYFFALGWDSTRRIYWDDLGMRFVGSPWITVKHLLAYPVEVLGCLLPWSVLLIAYLGRDFRESLKSAREQVIFLAIAIILAFPSCWLAPIGRSRYFMPLYPCFAVLVGIVVQRCCEAGATQKWRTLWVVFLTVLAGLMVGAGIVIPVVATVRKDSLGQPTWFLAMYGVAGRCPGGHDVVVESRRRFRTDRSGRAERGGLSRINVERRDGEPGHPSQRNAIRIRGRPETPSPPRRSPEEPRTYRSPVCLLFPRSDRSASAYS